MDPWILAVTVILTLYVGLSRSDYLQITHRETNPILAISLATGNLFDQAFGLPIWMGTVFGILLVEGDLAVQGGHSFHGPVIVKARLADDVCRASPRRGSTVRVPDVTR